MISTTSSEATKPKKYCNAGLRKDWNAKPARPVVAKSVLTPLPGFKLGGLDNDDITDIPPALAVGQAVGRVAAGGSRIRVAPLEAVEHLTFGFNQACFPPLFASVSC